MANIQAFINDGRPLFQARMRSWPDLKQVAGVKWFKVKDINHSAKDIPQFSIFAGNNCCLCFESFIYVP